MVTCEESKIWKVRAVKNYPEAQNHVLVGRIISHSSSHVAMHCRTYHFGKNINSPKDIHVGHEMVRRIPWSRIEVINELPHSFDYCNSLAVTDDSGTVVLCDNKYSCPLASLAERK